MTEQEYLDSERWPITTQKGLTYQEQRLIDEVNYDELKVAVEMKETLSSSEQQAWAELRQKLGR